MGDFGLLASRFNDNTNLLRRFDEALRYFKQSAIQMDSRETSNQSQKLLVVLKPVAQILSGRLSKTIEFDDQNVVEILHQRRTKDWQRYKDQVIHLTDKLISGDFEIAQGDFEILNDVADAIDTECANLFKRISGRT